MEEGWVPKKLDVYIDVLDIIDINHMRSKGNHPGEELLPDAEPIDEDSNQPSANEDIVAQLVSMGFNQLHCQKAAINTSNAGVEEAMNWLLSHMDDPDIDSPILKGNSSDNVDQSKVDILISFGFEDHVARKALKASGQDIEKATEWIFSNPNASVSSMDASASNTTSASNDVGLSDGGGKYRLIGIVSHMGTSTHCGHYVAHILKEGRWVIFNDAKVAVSVPRTWAIYIFSRGLMVELDTVFLITCLNIVMMNISSVKRIEWHKPATCTTYLSWWHGKHSSLAVPLFFGSASCASIL
ncbi:hypothetical protein HN51_022875 [Arachis hypogaea]|nr:Ubiquitin carboxyl-terminal hydrolase [Arachis hypogaea]